MAEAIDTDSVMSPAARVMNEAIELAIKGHSPHPARAVFIDADEPGIGVEIRRAAEEDRSVVLVAADGSTRTLFSEKQVELLTRSAGRWRNRTVSSLLLEALDNAYRLDDEHETDRRKADNEVLRGALEEALDDPELAPELLRGLAVMCSYGPDRPWRSAIDIAQQLGMSPSTVHRYIKTLRAVGLLEKKPSADEYRRAASVAR